MFFAKKKTIGLDIGNSSIKMVELEISKKGVELVSFQSIQTPNGCMKLGEIVDPEALASQIRTLVTQSKTKRKGACIGVWGTAVFVKRITVGLMDENIIGDQIRFEAEQILPYNLDVVNLDYQILRNVSRGQDSTHVLVVAAQKDFVFKYAEVSELAGLSCEVIDLSSFALANTFEMNYGVNKEGVVAVINIGSETSNFVVIEKGDVVLARDLPAGGLNYTNEIQRMMGISAQEAEDMKVSASNGQAAPPEVMEIISATHEVVIDAIIGTVQFYHQSQPDSPIRRLYVTGGSIKIPGLLDKIQEALQIPFEVLNPFQKMSFSPKNFSQDYIEKIGPYISVAVGLALRGGNE